MFTIVWFLYIRKIPWDYSYITRFLKEELSLTIICCNLINPETSLFILS